MTQMQNDEIDLYGLFQALWDGKWIISAFLGCGALLAVSFFLFTDAVYVSKVAYYIDTIPHAYEKDKVVKGFRANFYSKKVFKNWKKSNPETLLSFEDISLTKVVDGVVLLKKEPDLVSFESVTASDTFLLVKSSQLSLLDNVFRYADYINELLTNDYAVRERKSLKIVEDLSKNAGSIPGDWFEGTLLTSRYLTAVEEGAKALVILRPTPPKRSRSYPLITANLIVLGGMIGVFFVLVRNSIKKRNQQII